ncbi:MAG: hypothetical protein ABIH21_00735, partial [Patescibacteria group bacterium]
MPIESESSVCSSCGNPTYACSCKKNKTPGQQFVVGVQTGEDGEPDYSKAAVMLDGPLVEAQASPKILSAKEMNNVLNMLSSQRFSERPRFIKRMAKEKGVDLEVMRREIFDAAK